MFTRRRWCSTTLVLWVAAVLSLTAPARGQNTALTWTGLAGDSNWATAANWNVTSTGLQSIVYPNNGQPSAGNTYDVTLNGNVNVTQNAVIAINNFTFNGGTINTANVFTVSKFFNWNSGTVGGVGQFVIDGGANIAGSVYVNIPIINANDNTGLPVNVSVSAPVPIYANASSAWPDWSWISLSPTVFTFLSDGSLLNNTTTGRFDNSTLATFQKTGGTGTSTVAWNFQNFGTVNVTSGTLAFTGTYTDEGYVTVGGGATVQFNGPSTQPGVITVASGATAQFNGPSTWTYSARTSGSGTVQLLGPATFNGTNTLASPVTIGPGTTIDGTGALTISGPLTWNGGNIGAPSSPGSGTTTLSGGATINGSVFVNRAVMNAAGSTVTVPAAGSLFSNSGSVTWINQAGSVFLFTGDSGLAVNAGVGTFTNNNGATFAKTGGTGTSTVAWNFSNNGTVLVSSGTLSFAGSPDVTNYSGGTLTGGTWRVLAGSTLDLGSSRPVTTIAAGTTVEFNGPGSSFSAVENNVTGNGGVLNIFGGRSFAPSGMLTNTGILTVGQVAGDGTQFNAAVAVNSGGVLRGLGTVVGNATLGSGGTVSPSVGAAIGSLAAGGWTFQPAATYLIKYNPGTATPTAGSDNDTISSGTGALDLSGLTSTNRMTINLEPNAVVTPASGPVTYTAGAFSSVLLPTGVNSSNLSGLFAFTGNFSGTPTASLDASQTRLQFTFSPAVVSTWTWGGGFSGNWRDFSNWNPAVTPANGSQITFGATANPTMTNDSPGTLTVNSLTFTVGSPAYSLSGNGLNFVTNSGTGTLPQIVTNSSNSVMIGTALTLTNNLTVSGTGSLTLSGILAGPGGLTMNGTGMLTLSAANTYSGGTNVVSGTVQVAADAALGTGNVTGAAGGTVSFTGSTATTNSFVMNGGTIAVAAGQTLTLNGSQLSNAFLDGAGTFATNATNGALFIDVTTTPSVAIASNSAKDQFVHITNSAAMIVAAGVNNTGTGAVTLNGFTNEGLGSVTLAAGSGINVSNFQSYGVVTLNPNTAAAPTVLTNAGTSPLGFNAGTQTFIGTPQTADPTGQNVVAYIDLHGNNAVVAGGLFVNNGGVYDTSGAGTATIVADYGSLVKGAGFYQNTVKTQNGGKFQTGNSPGSATFGNFVFGPGGVSNYIFAIDDATGVAGPSPNAAGLVSGWGLIKAVQVSLGATTTSGNFTWTATPSNPLTVAIDTLVNPTMVGTDVAGPMADFNPNRAYSWTAAHWAGSFAGPTDVATLDADTSFDTNGFANPIAGTFGWSLDPADQTLLLVYTPSSVPEPGTLALVGLATAAAGYWRQRPSAVSRS